VVLLVRDDALRETIATIVDQLSNMLVTVVDDAATARRAVDDCPSSVLVVAPSWGDSDVASLLRELLPSDVATIVVSASPEDAALARHAAFVRAPFDVDTLLDAMDEAVTLQRPSRIQQIAR
jgi:DNA-binding NtrC family response regulator